MSEPDARKLAERIVLGMIEGFRRVLPEHAGLTLSDGGVGCIDEVARWCASALSAAREEAEKRAREACSCNCHDRTESPDGGPIFGPEHATHADCQSALIEEAHDIGRREREYEMLRAYHSTLDGLSAPPNEWPCNRAAALVRELREQLAASRAEAFKEAVRLVEKFGHGCACGILDALRARSAAPPKPDGGQG